MKIYTHIYNVYQIRTSRRINNMTSCFSRIPVIDLSLASSPTGRADLLSQLRHAVTAIGFLYISNHGVPEKVITDLVDILPVLFALPRKAKDEVELSNSPHFLGYSKVGAEMTAGAKDRREQFEFATELPDRWGEASGSGRPGYERLKGPNQVRVVCALVPTSIYTTDRTVAIPTPPSSTHSRKIHRRTHEPRNPLPTPSCRIPLPTRRDLLPLSLGAAPSQTRPLPGISITDRIRHRIDIHTRRRPAQRLLRLVDIPPPSLPPKGQGPPGPQQSRRVDRRPRHPGHIRREHRPGIRSRHERHLQSHHPQSRIRSTGAVQRALFPGRAGRSYQGRSGGDAAG